ncbi:MAG: polysaccharide deacetylase family protein [Nitrospirota bacterium]
MSDQPLSWLHHAKQISKPPIASALFYSGYYRARIRRVRNRAIILAYHRVGGPDAARGDVWANGFEHGVSAARFEGHMRFIREEMNPVSLAELAEHVHLDTPLPPRAIAVTFDDGYQDNYLHAFPILARYRIPATIFVPTGMVDSGRMFWWDQVFAMLRSTTQEALDLGSLPPHREHWVTGGRDAVIPLITRRHKTEASEVVNERMRCLPPDRLPETLAALRAALKTSDPQETGSDLLLTWKQILEMRNHGISIEAHTHSHRNLALLTDAEVEDELRTSKTILDEKFGAPIVGLAYPWGVPGTYTESVKRIARRVGFRYGCVIGPGTVGLGVDVFGLARVTVGNASLPLIIRDWLNVYAMEPARASQGDARAGRHVRDLPPQ